MEPYLGLRHTFKYTHPAHFASHIWEDVYSLVSFVLPPSFARFSYQGFFVFVFETMECFINQKHTYVLSFVFLLRIVKGN